MTATVISIEDSVDIPLSVRSLAEFRRWCFSPDFPVSGRIDYVQGAIEVDMSPEQAFSHSSVKLELLRELLIWNKACDAGLLFSDRMRVYNRTAQLSVEPDIVFVSHASLETGRVKLTKPNKSGDDYYELSGGPDLIVEIVSNSSVRKDTVRLLKAYFDAGVSEYWIVDGRSDRLKFDVFAASRHGFAAAKKDAGGLYESQALGHRVRLTRRRGNRGYWLYDFQMK